MADAQTRIPPGQIPGMAAVLQAPMDAITRHHYENLASGNEVRKNGKVHTVYTIQVEINGIPTLIPTVWDGKILKKEDGSPDIAKATKRAIASGKKWPQILPAHGGRAAIKEAHAKLRVLDEKIHETMKDISAEEAQDILDTSK